jgi:predicted acylesterase/phospholipase RssA
MRQLSVEVSVTARSSRADLAVTPAAPIANWLVGASHVQTELVYFDSTTDIIRTEHVMASGALPPWFPAFEIDGEYYWDGGVVLNTSAGAAK